MQKNNTMINKNIKSILMCIIVALTLFYSACSEKKSLYTVTYDFGYSGYTETETVSGGVISAPDKPLRFGHIFVEWRYFDGDEERQWNFETNIVDRNITLKAKWEETKKTPCVLTLEANGGECDIKNFDVYQGKQYSLPIPTRDGYYFDGWRLGYENVTEGIWKSPNNYTVYAKWTTYPPGMTVKIGRFEQDNDLTNGSEDIEWYVIDYKDGKYFLFSKYILTGMYFSENNKKNWDTSIIREWLNDEFYESAFADEERKFINETYLEDIKVTDKVFALSYDEVKNIAAARETTFGYKTNFTASQGLIGGARIDDISIYWYYVRNGFVMDGSNPTYQNTFPFAGVRPGIWISEEYLDFENS